MLHSAKQNGNCLKLEDHGREAAEGYIWDLLRGCTPMARYFLVIYISTWQSCSLFPNTRMYLTWYPHKSVLNPDAGSGVPDFQGRFPSLNGLKKHPQGDHWLQHCWQRCRNAFFGSGEADQKSHSYGIDGPFTDALPMMTFRSFHRFLHGGAPKPYVWWFLEPNSCSSTCTHTHIYIYVHTFLYAP